MKLFALTLFTIFACTSHARQTGEPLPTPGGDSPAPPVEQPAVQDTNEFNSDIDDFEKKISKEVPAAPTGKPAPPGVMPPGSPPPGVAQPSAAPKARAPKAPKGDKAAEKARKEMKKQLGESSKKQGKKAKMKDAGKKATKGGKKAADKKSKKKKKT